MPNYKQNTLSAEVYQRCKRIIIENKKDDIPSITFSEEEVYTLGGKEKKEDVGQFTLYFDPNGTFDLINPLTNEPLGQTASHQELQVLLYSLYMQGAIARDSQ